MTPLGFQSIHKGKLIAAEARHTLRSHAVLHQHTAALTPPPTGPCLKGNQFAGVLSCITTKLDTKWIHILDTGPCVAC